MNPVAILGRAGLLPGPAVSAVKQTPDMAAALAAAGPAGACICAPDRGPNALRRAAATRGDDALAAA